MSSPGHKFSGGSGKCDEKAAAPIPAADCAVIPDQAPIGVLGRGQIAPVAHSGPYVALQPRQRPTTQEAVSPLQIRCQISDSVAAGGEVGLHQRIRSGPPHNTAHGQPRLGAIVPVPKLAADCVDL